MSAAKPSGKWEHLKLGKVRETKDWFNEMFPIAFITTPNIVPSFLIKRKLEPKPNLHIAVKQLSPIVDYLAG